MISPLILTRCDEPVLVQLVIRSVLHPRCALGVGPLDLFAADGADLLLLLLRGTASAQINRAGKRRKGMETDRDGVERSMGHSIA